MGGHVKAEGSVWRIALGGPKKYHEMVTKDALRFAATKRVDRGAPELEMEEAKEYVLYCNYLKEKGKDIAEDKDFYKWLEKDKAEIEVKDDELFVTKPKPKK